MRPIDADELRRKMLSGGYVEALRHIDAAPTVDVSQPLTRDDVLAAVKAIEDAGGKAVVEWMDPFAGVWASLSRSFVEDWRNPDEPRGNVRVRAVEVETEDVPLTQLVGRTIKGETLPVSWSEVDGAGPTWFAVKEGRSRDFPDGTLDLATGLVTVLKGDA